MALIEFPIEVVSYPEQAGDPPATANRGKTYTKDVATVTQLFYQASDGTVYQVTPGSTLPAAWTAGVGTPNGAVVGSPGDLYSNTSGGAGITLWVKESGAATNTGWIPVPVTPQGTTAARPVTPTQGTMYIDTTLGLPIWYLGVIWIDAAGVSV